MRLCYLDEAGNSGRNLRDPQQPYFILGGLVLRSTKWRAVTDELREVIRDAASAIQKRLELDSRFCRGWSKRRLGKDVAWSDLDDAGRRRLRDYFDERFEIHAVDIAQGHGCFEGLDMPTRSELLSRFVAIAERHELEFLYVLIDKARHAAACDRPDPPGEVGFMLFAELFDSWLKSCDGEGHGMLIADHVDHTATLKANLRRYQRQGTDDRGVAVDRIIDSVHFVKSHESPCTQLSDVLNYFVLQQRRGNARWEDPARRVDRLVAHRKLFP